MLRYVVKQGPDDYHLYSAAMCDISGHQSRTEMATFLLTCGMTAEDAEEVIVEAEQRSATETRKLMTPSLGKPRWSDEEEDDDDTP